MNRLTLCNILYMKTFPLLAIIIIVLCSFTGWETNFIVAQKKAAQNHKLILLNFSGSDWCGPCMRMRNEIFNDSGFSKMADTNLIMVNADFPRNKKNKLATDLQKQNNILADKYNPEGKFPYTVLINADGKLIKTWDGLPDEDALKFTTIVKSICNANK
jgi:thioredoxin-related protein